MASSKNAKRNRRRVRELEEDKRSRREDREAEERRRKEAALARSLSSASVATEVGMEEKASDGHNGCGGGKSFFAGFRLFGNGNRQSLVEELQGILSRMQEITQLREQAVKEGRLSDPDLVIEYNHLNERRRQLESPT
ncbi:MAG: hypothetical protein Q8O75_02780 [bacterium]|nr:hypothetical protein [bacterium]